MVAFQGDSGLTQVGKHANVRVGSESGDLEEAQEIAAGRYQPDPALPLYLANGVKKN